MERVVKVKYNGKEVEVVLRKISWLKAQKLIGESTILEENKRKLDLEKLRVNLVKYAIKEIKGADVKSVERFLDEIDFEEGNKILEVALELNPLERIIAV